MSHSKPNATCFEVIILTIICILIGACLYISLHDVPSRNENTTKSIIPIKAVPLTTGSSKAVSSNTASSKAASIDTISFVPIQQPTTPKTQLIKFITIDPEHNP
jgi:hypothetical protein